MTWFTIRFDLQPPAPCLVSVSVPGRGEAHGVCLLACSGFWTRWARGSLCRTTKSERSFFALLLVLRCMI